MAAVSVGLITNDDTSPHSTSVAFRTALQDYMTATHVYTVTYYEASQIAAALAAEDFLVIDFEGLNADGGGGSYGDVSAAIDAGLPVAGFGLASAGPSQYIAELCGGTAPQYQGPGGSQVPSSLDTEGILAAAGFSADDDFDATGDGDVAYLTGTLAPGLQVLVETDTGGFPAAAILPAGGAKVGGGTVTNSIAWLTPRHAGGPALDAFNLQDAIFDYLYTESTSGGGTTPVSKDFPQAAEHVAAVSKDFAQVAEHEGPEPVEVSRSFAQAAEHVAQVSRSFVGAGEHTLGDQEIELEQAAEHLAAVVATFAQVAEHTGPEAVSASFVSTAEHLARVEASHSASAEHVAPLEVEFSAVAEHVLEVVATFAQVAEHESESAVSRSFVGAAEHLAIVVGTEVGSGEHVAPVSASWGSQAEHLATVEATFAQVAEHYAFGAVARSFEQTSEHLAPVGATFAQTAEHDAEQGVSRSFVSPAEHLAAVLFSTDETAEHLATVGATMVGSAEHLGAELARSWSGAAEHLASVSVLMVARPEHLAGVSATFAQVAEHTATYVTLDPAPWNILPAEPHTRNIPARRRL